MIVGVDVDNTLVRWDLAFHQAALEAALITAAVPRTKSAVKAAVIAGAGERAWTRLQGTVYGEAQGATLFDGARRGLEALRAAGAHLVLVSHKTPRPVLGPPHDLIAAARRVLRQEGILGEDGVSEDDAWFEPTLSAKLARIATLGCDVFIDDLPSVLLSPAFPTRATGVLFDPAGAHPAFSGRRCRGWPDVRDEVLRLVQQR
jgi:hypothetical protein